MNTPVLETGKPPGFVGSNPIPPAIFAAEGEVDASPSAFNHTAEAMRSEQPKLYASRCVNDNLEGEFTQWKSENKKAAR